jgi:hypothetical protein
VVADGSRREIAPYENAAFKVGFHGAAGEVGAGDQGGFVLIVGLAGLSVLSLIHR